MEYFTHADEKKSKTPLRILSLSGTESVTKNLTIYEYGEDIIIVDCGVGFPDSEMYGVDVVIPDFSYLVQTSKKIRGLFVTHAHDDHFGAVPYFLEQCNVPVYAGRLVLGFLNKVLEEKKFKNLAPTVHLNQLDYNKEVTLGPFRVSAFRVNHSVPDSMGLAIKTPEGLILHMADFKIDWTPILDEPIDLGTIAQYGKEGVLCLLSDCLGVEEEGPTKTERVLNDTFFELFDRFRERQVFVTTISTNISRMYQIISIAMRYGRKIVPSGRSIDQSIEIARKLGYLPFSPDIFISEKEAAECDQKSLIYIIAGCYGQPGSSLGRLSRNEHNALSLESDAVVIFSGDPNPPGADVAVEKVISDLILQGCEVLYSGIQDNLHVSGHGTRGDLTAVAAVVKPKYFIPIGGTVAKMRGYTRMVRSLGMDGSKVFENLEGDSVEFLHGRARKGEFVETKQVFINTKTAEEISPVVVKDRGQLSEEGIFVVIIPQNKQGDFLSSKVDVITRGLIYVKGSRDLMDRSKKLVSKGVAGASTKSKDWEEKKKKIERDLERFLYRETGKSPLIMMHTIAV